MAKPHDARRRLRATSSVRSRLLAGTALQAAVLAVLAQPAAADPAQNAHPLGGVVTAGSATIVNAPGVTTITQTSGRAAIQWNSFNVGVGQTVDFVQPSSNAVALNRVVGANPSQIAGRIDANGQVILINQDGVTFYKGAQVNTAGLVVSAAGITTQNFMAGRMVFDQTAKPGARIVNAGTLTISQAGLAALVAPQVANSGVITAKLGHVVLAGAATETLDLYGDGLVAIDVSGQVAHGPGDASALVTNTGTITAVGGTVQLTARAADGVVRTLIQADGTISASSLGGQGGTILLDGVGGNIAIAGQVLAQGLAAGSRGGAIQILPGGTVAVAYSARIDASGAAGGGTIALGTTLARAVGGPTVTGARTSQAVTVAAGAVIAADATGQGNGGSVTLLASDSTVMAGSIFARGGADGGNGGVVEVSGGALSFSGSIDVGASLGTPGSVLFDPGVLDIVAGASGSGSLDSLLPTIATGSPDSTGTYTVSVGALQAITSGNILLQAQSSLEVKSNVTFATSGSVTLQSSGNLTVDSGVTVTSTTVSNLSLLSSGGGAITLSGATLSAPALTLHAGGGGLVLDTASVSAAGLLDLAASGGGSISQSAGGAIGAGTLTATVASGGGITLGSTLNAVSTLTTATATNDAFVLASDRALAVTGPVSAATVTLSTGTGDMSLAGNVTGTTGVSLTAAGGIAQLASGAVTTGTLTASAGNGIALGSTLNAIGTVNGASAGSGRLVLTNSGNLVLAGTLSGQSATIGVAAAGDTLSLGTGLVTAALTGTMGVALQADRITEGAGSSISTGTVAGTGTVSIAPFSASPISLAGSSGAHLLLDSTLLGEISTGTLLVGSTPTTTGISVDGAVNLAGHAKTLVLSTTGSIAEPGGPLTVGTLTASAGVGIALGAPLNAIGTVDGAAAGSGALVLTNGDNLVLAGALSGQNATIEVAAAGGTLALGAALVTAALTGTVGVALQADRITETAGSSITTGTVAGTGTVSLAPFSAIPISLAGAAGAHLLISSTLLGEISTGTLVVGSTATATAISVDGAVDLTGRATTLVLSTSGSIAEPGGPLTVGTLTAAAGSGIVLGSILNAIGTVDGATAGSGSLVLTDAGDLTLAGGIGGAPGVTLTAAHGSITQAAGSVIGTGTLSATVSGSLDLGSTLNAIGTLGILSAGTSLLVANGTSLAVAGPVSAAGVTLTTGTGDLTLAGSVTGTTDVSLAAAHGSMSQSAGSVLSTATLAAAASGSLDLGSTLNAIATLGSLSAGPSLLVANAASIAVAGPVTAAAVTLTAATGSITQAAGSVLTTATLNGSAPGAVDFGSTLNAIGALGSLSAGPSLLVANGTSFAVAGLLSAASVTLTATGGSITQSAPSSISTSALTASATGSLDLGSTLNAIATLGSLTAGASLLVANASSFTVAGALTAMTVTLAASAGSITQSAASVVTAGTLAAAAPGSLDFGSTLNAIATLGSLSAGAALVVANSKSLTAAGPVGAGTIALTVGTGDLTLAASITGNTSVSLTAATGSIAQSGSAVLTTGTLTASAAGSLDLGSTLNAISAVDGATAGSGNLSLADGGNLTLLGRLSGQNISVDVATAGDTLALGGGAVTANLTATSAGGSIALLADRITEIAGNSLAAGSVIVIPVSNIPVSLAGTPGAHLLLDTTLLGEITTGTLVIGATQNTHQVPVNGATAISVDGAAALAGRAGTLDLLTSGSITEPGGVLTVSTLAATAGTGIALDSSLNAVGTLIAGSTAAGALVLVNGGNLAVAQALGNQGVTLEVATAGGTLILASDAALSAPGGGTVTLIADRISDTPGAAITAGTVAVAPFSAIPISLAGTPGASLTIDATLLGEVTTSNTLIVGSATLVGGGTTTATAIAIDGAVNLPSLPGTLLLRISGSITEPGGPLTVGTLTASAGIGIALASTLNAIGTVDGAAAGSGALVLTDGGNLTLAGTLSGQSATLTSGGSLAVLAGITATGPLSVTAGTGLALAGAVPVSAASLLLNGGTGGITLSGTGVIGNAAATVDLAGGGGVSEATTATIQAAVLTSSAGVAGSVALLGTVNAIARIGAFAVTGGGLTLADGGTLLVSGPVAATSIALGSGGSVPATLDVTGSIIATQGLALVAAGGGITLGPAASLDAASVALSGAGPIVLSAGAAIGDAQSVVSFSSTGGAVVQDAASRITAATLDSLGSIAGAADLAGTANAIAALGSLSAGSLTLADGGAASLTIAGRVAATGSVLIGGAAPPGSISVVGSLTGAAVTLAAGSGGIRLTGSLAAIGIAELDVAGGGVQQSGGFVAGTLQTAGMVGPVTFGSASVATLGAFAVSGGTLALANTSDLVVAGPVTAASIAITSAGTLTLAGTLTTSGLLALTASPGGIVLGTAVAPALLSAGTVTLAGTAPISEPNGSILASTLAVSDAAAVALNGAANQIATLAAVSVHGGAFRLTDTASAALTVVGPVAAVSVALGTPTALTLAGSIAASDDVTLSAGSGGIGFGNGAQPATVTAATLALNSAGTISEPNGVITAGTLIASSAGTTSLGSPANAIATLGAVTAGGDFVLADDAVPLLTVTGPVTANNVVLDPTALAIAGAITAAGQISVTAGAGGIAIAGRLGAGTLTLTSLGDITEPGGSISAAVLQGSSVGATKLDGNNAIGQIASFTAGTAFTLADATSLTLADTLSAPLIDVAMPTGALSLADGATILTGGTPEPGDFALLDATIGGATVIAAEVPTATVPAKSAGLPVGAYLTVGAFAQLGTSRVNAITAGGASILDVTAGGTGNITFTNLLGLNTWLLIGINQGAVAGNIYVKALTLQYPPGYAGATLSGSINAVAGPGAAGVATILPLPNSKFSLNHCPIHSVNCVLLPTEAIPTTNPLENFSIGAQSDPNEDENLLLPIVSDQDY